MTSTIPLATFEQIDSLMAACLRRPALETLPARDAYIAEWFRPEWQLEAALVDAFGLAFVDDHADAVECAAFVVTQALLGLINVVDEVSA